MRHRMAHRKLGRVTSHRIAMLRNLATALFERERIQTTLAKAKELRPFAERLITISRRSDDRLHARRLVLRDIKDPVVVRKLFDTLGTRYADRPGGYTRILKVGARRSDGAEMALVELVGAELKVEDEGGAEKKGSRKKAGGDKKPARKTPPREKRGGSRSSAKGSTTKKATEKRTKAGSKTG